MNQLLPEYEQWNWWCNVAEKSDVADDEIADQLLAEYNKNGTITETELIQWANSPKNSDLNESALGKLLGGLTGFALGKKLGKIIAKALGIEKGILFDLLSSRIFSTMVGVAIGKRR